MNNPYILVWILCSKVLGNQTTMALFGSIFGAEETALVEVLNFISLCDVTVLKDLLEYNGIAIPVNDLVLVIFEQLLRWGQIRDMDIICSTYLLHKELQIGALGKAGKLACVIDADVDELLDSGILEQTEELSSVLLRETNGI